MSLSRQEAADTIAAVQTAFDAGAPAPGGPSGRGRPSAIAVAARQLNLNPQSVRDRISADGPCASYGLFVDWRTDDDVVQFPRGMSTFATKDDRKRAAARGELGFDPVLPGYEIDKTTSVEDEVGNVSKRYITQKRERGESFVMPPAHAIKGVSALVDGSGRTIQQWIKTREDADQTQLFIDAIKSTFDEYKGAANFVPEPEVTDDETLTVYPIADLHVGMYSWAAETGDDYDLSIVKDLFTSKMKQLVTKATPSDTAIILNLGDYFHSDSRSNRTEHSGAELDVDSRYARVLQIGVRLMIQCIELALCKHRRVIVRNLPGNHDYHASLALTTALGAFFHDSDRVVVDHDPSKFFVHKFGETLIVATHGDMAKPAQMPGIVAARWPKLWGDTRFRYCYTGHIHHRSVIAGELNGMICESFQTIAAKDFWHASMGYCAGRSLVAITHDKVFGETDRVTASVPPAFGSSEMRRAA